MGEMKSMQMGVIGALFLSVASSVSIVICNKALMTNLGFPFGNYYFPLYYFVTIYVVRSLSKTRLFVLGLIVFFAMVLLQQQHLQVGI